MSATAERNDGIDDATTLVMERRFAQPPETVFDAWADPEKVACWMGPGACVTTVDRHDLRPGGVYRWVLDEADGRHVVSGTFLAVERPRRLTFTWMWESEDWGGVIAEVVLAFEADGAGTKMVLAQTKLPSENAVRLHGEGWAGSFDRLDGFLGR